MKTLKSHQNIMMQHFTLWMDFWVWIISKSWLKNKDLKFTKISVKIWKVHNISKTRFSALSIQNTSGIWLIRFWTNWATGKIWVFQQVQKQIFTPKPTKLSDFAVKISKHYMWNWAIKTSENSPVMKVPDPTDVSKEKKSKNLCKKGLILKIWLTHLVSIWVKKPI